MGIPRFENAPDFDNAYDFSEESIGTIYLTGGGYVNRPFKGIAYDSKYGWEELVWAKNPSRSLKTFAFTNLDNIDIGLVARCEFSLKYLNYDDYIALRNILARERSFYADFFDTDSKKWVHREMYCSSNEKDRFFSLNQSLIGAINYSIKLVGTNRDTAEQKKTLSVTYSDSGVEYIPQTDSYSFNISGGKVNTPNENGISLGTQYVTGSKDEITQIPNGYSFKYWVNVKDGRVIGCYGPKQSTTLWDSLNLHPCWEKAN